MHSPRPWRTELTPLAFLDRAAAVFSDEPAVTYGARCYSYGELGCRVNRFASALRRLGLARHERVALISPNTPAMLEAHFAVPAAGGVLVAINTRLHPDEIGRILDHCEARIVVVDAELDHLLASADARALREVVLVDDTGSPADPYEQLLASGQPQALESWLADEEEPVSINYTSGTTGRPKGVLWSHRGAYLNALGEVIEAALGPRSTYLWSLPLYHCNGACFPWAVTAVAGRHLLTRRPEPAEIWDLLLSGEVTHYDGPPSLQAALVAAAQGRTLGQPVTAVIGGAPPAPALLERLVALGVRPLHVYGLTETYGHIARAVERGGDAGLAPRERTRRLARQGAHILVADPLRVVDAQMRDVPRDGATIGEVIMRGNNVALGYWRDPEATAEAFCGGWFHSGDLAVWHTNGDVELRDRSKDIVIVGADNVSSIEVERAIAEHPAVLECAVVAVFDEECGERPKAFVTLREGASAAEDELLEFCRARLSTFAIPREVEFGPLPKTGTGKVSKEALRSRARESFG